MDSYRNSFKRKIYFNGILDSSGELFKPRNVERNSSFIGKSNWDHDPKFDASLDEIKIFNRALFVEEIIEEAKSSRTLFDIERPSGLKMLVS